MDLQEAVKIAEQYSLTLDSIIEIEKRVEEYPHGMKIKVKLFLLKIAQPWINPETPEQKQVRLDGFYGVCR